MKVAVLSGKGGAGKTYVSTNLALAAASNTEEIVRYLDCDVEEPNGHLFLKPTDIKKSIVYRRLPVFDMNKCDGCRKCVDFCKFNALAYVKDGVKLFDEICHSCGGCEIVCPQDAIKEENFETGFIEVGQHGELEVISGYLNLGEASGVSVISNTLNHAKDEDINIIDCPPGSACTVMESVSNCDYAILVVEPTSFGIHNFKMVHELVDVLKVPCGVIINKSTGKVAELEKYCEEANIKILSYLPFSKKIAESNAESNIAYEVNEEIKSTFDNLFKIVNREV